MGNLCMNGGTGDGVNSGRGLSNELKDKNTRELKQAYDTTRSPSDRTHPNASGENDKRQNEEGNAAADGHNNHPQAITLPNGDKFEGKIGKVTNRTCGRE